MPNALGRHLILELYKCDQGLLDDLVYVEQTLTEAAINAGGDIVGKIFHRFCPFGVTGVVAIAESHLSIHTWPEIRYAAVDIFTCGDKLNPEHAANYIVERFRAQDKKQIELRRGILTPEGAKVSYY